MTVKNKTRTISNENNENVYCKFEKKIFQIS